MMQITSIYEKKISAEVGFIHAEQMPFALFHVKRKDTAED